MNQVSKIQETEIVAQVDPMVSMIERIATDPDSDLEKLERMLSMKERLDNESSRRAYFDAMADAQAEMEPVARNKRNNQTNSNYSDLAEIYKSCKPVATKHGLSFSTYPSSCEKPGHMGVRWIVRHKDGHYEEDVADIPIDAAGLKGTKNKTDTHAFGSTASYARRYLFCMIFDIATSDDNDGNNETIETISQEQFIELRDLILETGTDEVKFHKAHGAKFPEKATLHEFPVAKFEAAKAQLIRKKERPND